MPRKLKKHELREMSHPRSRNQYKERLERGQMPGRSLLVKGRPYQSEEEAKAGEKTVLIVTEGSETEPNYFRGLVRHLGLAGVDIWHPEKTDPEGLVEEACAKRKERFSHPMYDSYDEVWVVCDGEGPHHSYRKKLPAARQKARANDIQLAVSLPSFEFWLLLHYVYTTKDFPSAKAVTDYLKGKGRMPNYEKNLQFDPAIFAKTSTALTNAERLRSETAIREPATDVDKLVVSLCGIKRGC